MLKRQHNDPFKLHTKEHILENMRLYQEKYREFIVIYKDYVKDLIKLRYNTSGKNAETVDYSKNLENKDLLDYPKTVFEIDINDDILKKDEDLKFIEGKRPEKWESNKDKIKQKKSSFNIKNFEKRGFCNFPIDYSLNNKHNNMLNSKIKLVRKFSIHHKTRNITNTFVTVDQSIVNDINHYENSPYFIELKSYLLSTPINANSQIKIEKYLLNQGILNLEMKINKDLDINFNKLNYLVLKEFPNYYNILNNFLNNLKQDLKIGKEGKNTKIRNADL